MGIQNINLHKCLLIIIASIHSVTGLAPEISLQPCTVPMKNQVTRLCCETKRIHSATVSFHYKIDNSWIKVATVHYPCNTTLRNSTKYNITCDSDNISTSVYQLEIAAGLLVLGVWSCQYYGGKATYQLQEQQILDYDIGTVYVNNTQNATLNWDLVNTSDFTISNPSGDTMLTVRSGSTVFEAPDIKYNTTGRYLSVVLIHVTPSDNGTYVHHNNGISRGITLIVLEKLDKPNIVGVNITKKYSTNTVSGSLVCRAVSKAAAPYIYFYSPDITVTWKYPLESSEYNITRKGNVLVIAKVNCGINRSQPVLCQAQEHTSPKSDLQHFYPHSLCYPPFITTPAPVPATSDNSKEANANILAAVLSGIFAVFLMLILLAWWRIRRHGHCNICDIIGDCCGCCCKFLGKCCRRTICKKCIKDDYLDTDSDLDRYINGLRREDESNDWSHIANVYTPSDAPSLSIPRSRTDSVPLPLPPIPLDLGISNSGADLDESSTDTDAPSPAEASTSSFGAEAVDRNQTIREVENCLKSLKKSLSHIQQQVQVTRENLIENLLDIYADPAIVDAGLHIKVMGEEGSDWGGVSRDVFTSFWNGASDIFFKGHALYTPYLPPHKLEDMYKFRLLGRILSHSTAILGYIPVPICKSSMMVMILDATEISEDILIEDFLLFLDEEDRTLVHSALVDYSSLSEDEQDKLQDVFIRFEMGCVLQENTFRDQVLKMSRMELVIKPRSLCEKLREGIPEVHYERFWSQLTLEHLGVLYDRLKPTPNKVLACLRAESVFVSETRRAIYDYFKTFVRTLSEKELEKLLHFITGQSCVPKRTITVQFSSLSGAERRPIAHTCSYSIELPDSYDSYEEFEQEFKSLLEADILRFDIQ